MIMSRFIEFSRAHGPDRRVFLYSRARPSSFLDQTGLDGTNGTNPIGTIGTIGTIGAIGTVPPARSLSFLVLAVQIVEFFRPDLPSARAFSTHNIDLFDDSRVNRVPGMSFFDAVAKPQNFGRLFSTKNHGHKP